MARNRRMDPDMARAVAFDRLAAKAHRNGEDSGRFIDKSLALKKKVHERRKREAAQAQERKLFEADVKSLGLQAAMAAAKERKSNERLD